VSRIRIDGAHYRSDIAAAAVDGAIDGAIDGATR
jgi:hypothetical protein